MAKNHTFTFMGTGAGCGMPAFYCECRACKEARTNPKARRGDCGAMVRHAETGKTMLIDTPPDTRHQLIREGVHEIDELMITHCHSDHISGLCEFEYMVQLRTKKNIPTYGSVDTLGEVAVEFHYMDYALDLNTMEPFETHDFDGVRYTALPVKHAPGTYGYLIDTGDTRLFYASDTGQLPEETRERIRDVDILALDATYWKTGPSPAHLSVPETIAEGLALNAGKIYLTHLWLHEPNPVTLDELEKYCAQYEGRVAPAYDGLSFAI